jgi:acetylornithine/N-succinyldiaminopimelate aminotransferase
VKLANALVAQSCFDQVFFANSGAQANEGAIKLARKYGALHRNGRRAMRGVTELGRA